MSEPDQPKPSIGPVPDPRLLNGIVDALQIRLADKQAGCVAAIERLIGALENVAEEPSAGLTDEIIAELAAARRSLGDILSGGTVSAEELAGAARRLSLLAQTYSVLAASDVGRTTRDAARANA